VQPKTGTLVSNDGRESRVLILTGTAPIHFQGARYNIPVELYVLPAHPAVPPQAFVRPTQAMMVKPNHQHVGTDGMIYLPYLNSWGGSSNLVDLLGVMSLVFSADPPLFARPANAGAGVSGADAAHASPVSHGQAVSAGGGDSHDNALIATATAHHALSSSGSSSGAGAGVGTGSASGGAMNSITHQSSFEASDAFATVARNSMVDTVAARLKRALHAHYCALQADVDKEMRNQRTLDANADACVAGDRVIASEEVRIAHGREELCATRTSLDQWANEAQQKKLREDALGSSGGGASAAEKAAELMLPKDALAAQAVRLAAEHDAIDDVLYYLERALASRDCASMDLGAFMKETRALSRRQFLTKAHLKKVRAAQLNAR